MLHKLLYGVAKYIVSASWRYRPSKVPDLALKMLTDIKWKYKNVILKFWSSTSTKNAIKLQIPDAKFPTW